MATLFIIFKAETTLDIWKDVLAITFIVEIDSMVYAAMKKGLFGTMLKKVANETVLTVDVNVEKWQTAEKLGCRMSFMMWAGLVTILFVFHWMSVWSKSL
jgi:hypothetical protein